MSWLSLLSIFVMLTTSVTPFTAINWGTGEHPTYAGGGGALTAAGNVEAQNVTTNLDITAGDDVIVGDDLTVGDDATVAGTFHVDGTVDFDQSLIVDVDILAGDDIITLGDFDARGGDIKNSTGNLNIDAVNAAAHSTVYILNSDGTYEASLDIERNLAVAGTGLITGILTTTGGIICPGLLAMGSGVHFITNGAGLLDGTKIQDDTVNNDTIDNTDSYTIVDLVTTGDIDLQGGDLTNTTGNINIDAQNAVGNSTVYIKNSDAVYKASLNVENNIYAAGAFRVEGNSQLKGSTEFGGGNAGSGAEIDTDGNGTFNGDMDIDGETTVGTGVGAASVYIDGAAEEYRGIYFLTNDSERWAVVTDITAEGGADAGSNLVVANYDDSGNLIGAAMTIERATGDVDFVNDISNGGDLEVEGGAMTAGEDGAERGVITVHAGAGGNTPGHAIFHSPDKSAAYLFADDNGRFRVAGAVPTLTTDGYSLGGALYVDANHSTLSPAGAIEALFDVNFTLPANSMTMGCVFRLTASYKVLDNNAADTLKIRVRIGGLTGSLICETTAYNPDDDDTGVIFVTGTPHAVGAGGSAHSTFQISQTKNSVNTMLGGINHPALDTTIANILCVTYEWSASHAENDVELQTFILEKM